MSIGIGIGLGLGTGGGFSPLSVTSAAGVFWLNSGAGAFNSTGPDVLATNGQSVTLWDNGFGNANYDAQQTNASSRPTWRSADGPSSRPTIRFAGASTQFFDFVSGSLSALTAGEIFVVMKRNADPAASAALSGFWAMGSSTEVSLQAHVPFTDGTVYENFGTTTRQTTINPTPSLASWCLYNVSAAASDFNARINGTSFYSTATNTVGFATAPKIGVSVAVHYDGDFAEIIMYNAKLSTADRAGVNGYIATKYGLTIA